MNDFLKPDDEIALREEDSRNPSELTALTDSSALNSPTISAVQVVEAVLTCLESVGDEIGEMLDHGQLRRNLSNRASEVAKPGDVTSNVHAMISESAAAANLRIDLLRVLPSEAIEFLRPAAPLAKFWISDSGRLEWLLLTESRRRKVRIIDSVNKRAVWQSRAKFFHALDNNAAAGGTWVAFQPMLLCHSRSTHGDPRQTPWERYVELLAPERSDMGVILVFAVLVGILTLSTPIAVESLVNTVAFGQLLQPVIVLALLLFIFLAFAAVIRALQVYVAEIIQRRIFVRIAGDLVVRLPRVPHDFWMTHYGPELINRFFEVVTVQKVTAQLLLDGIALVLQALIGMAVIAFYHPILLGFDVVLILMIVAVVFLLGRGAVSTSIDESRQKYATAAWLEELARHPLAFRSTGGMSLALDHGDRLITSYVGARSSHFRILMRQTVAMLALQVVASTVLLGLGGWLVIRGELTLGQLVAAELIVTVIVGSFAKIAKYLDSYYDVMASVDKLWHLLDMPMELSKGIDLPRKSIGISLTIHDLITHPLPGGLKVHTKTLQVQAGERVALVGPNSNLRRSLVQTIAGLQEPVSGHVELDELDCRRLRPESIYDQIAVVADPEVFEGTIAENIHLGRFDVAEIDIRAALQSVGLLDEFLDLPLGLSTTIGTDGRQFSHEQLVRLMLARAIAVKPRLLLIDGAMDVLPDATIEVLLRNLLDVLPGATVIISTGRRKVAELCRRQWAIDGDGYVHEVTANRLRAPSTV